MTVRHFTDADLPRILEIYEAARAFMRKNGNPTQWVNHPRRSLLEQDIQNQTGYVLEEDGHIYGVFAFILGEDPTYLNIEDGAWLNDEPYGTIHRIASSFERPGILAECVKFCLTLTDSIRIDTHEDNLPMQHALQAQNFRYCGVIYVCDDVSDHSPRIAYQYAKN